MKQTLLVTILFLAPIPLAGRELPAAAAQNPARIDVTGKWTFEVTTSAGSGMPTVTFKQSGDTLTGHYSSTNLGEADLTGTVKGTAIEFSFTIDVQGQQAPATYKGTVEKNTMKGTMDIAGMVNGTFTATKK